VQVGAGSEKPLESALVLDMQGLINAARSEVEKCLSGDFLIIFHN